MLSLMSHAKLLLLWLVVCGGERLVAANSRNALSYAVPTCINNRGASYVVDRHISVDILSVNRTESGKNCPYAIDHKGKHRYAEHMCFGANTTFICIMKMVNITVSNWGALMEGDHHSKKIVSLRDDTLVGGHPPRYWPDATQTLLKGVTIALQKFRPMNSLIPARSLVIPTRYRWDDCFNHLSFQSMPLIGMVYEFQPDIFFSSYWHASQFTAALLLLLGVRMDRLIIGENVYAKSVVLPWVPHWNPIQGAPMRGISRRVSLLATSALLNISSLSTVETISPLDFRLQPLSVNSIGADERFIVYFQRSEGRRFVENEKEVLAAITQHLRPGYRVVVMPPTKEYKTIDKLHAVWRQYAQIVNRAIVIIGPHGGGMNNMMWAPGDCDMIEFNEFPDDLHYTQSHGKTPVRKVFLNAFWARSDESNEYYNIAAARKDPENFYEGPIAMAIPEILDVFRLIKGGRLFQESPSISNSSRILLN